MQQFDHGRQEETRYTEMSSQFIVPRRVASVCPSSLIKHSHPENIYKERLTAVQFSTDLPQSRWRRGSHPLTSRRQRRGTRHQQPSDPRWCPRGRRTHWRPQCSLFDRCVRCFLVHLHDSDYTSQRSRLGVSNDPGRDSRHLQLSPASEIYTSQ
ncbi:hypothetical protein B0H17DRAFT_107212 [Mycena rosella]|uniref:Uncharacterized protein n=1 Tax=Mycena rosella TaxID=1033263 RepID=A0AAD7D5S9_MYCRO|nr:hypothetical protein B0H17DRAFT_107212 [Mycena rosella]